MSLHDFNKLPLGEFNLPPGVSSRDIEGLQEYTCERCDGSGILIRDDVEGIEYIDCPSCSGLGVINTRTKKGN